MRIIQAVFAIAICMSSLHGQEDSITFYFEKGLDLKKQGLTKEAIVSMESALQFNGPDSLSAASYHQLGNLNYGNKQYQHAIDNWRRAITLRTNYLQFNHVDIIRTFINIGTAENILGNTNHSHNALSTALTLLNSQKVEDVFRKANVYAAIGRLEKNELNLSLALNYLEEAYRLYALCNRDINWRQVNTCTDLFDTYKLLQKPNKALLWAERGMEEVRRISTTNRAYDIYMANAYSNRGIAYKLNDQFENAEADYLMALSLNQKLPERTNYLGIVLNNLIALYSKMDDVEKAEDMIHQARAIFIQYNQPQLLVNTLIEEAKFRYDQADYFGALDAYAEARQTLSYDDDQQFSKLIRAAINETTVVDLVTGQLKSKMALYRLNKEKNILSDIDSLINELANSIDEISFGMSDLESKLELSRLVNDFFDVAITIKYLMYKEDADKSIAEDAWKLMDKAKSRSIVDNLRLDKVSENSKFLSATYNRRKAVQDQIFQYQTMLTSELEPEQYLLDSIMGLQAASSQLDLKIDSLIQSEQLWQIDGDTSHKNIQAPETLFLQYHLAKDSSYLICKYQNNIQFHNLGSTGELENQLLIFFEATREPSSDVTQYCKIASSILKTLFPLAYRTKIPKSIIIIPDRLIGKIPFEAMLVNECLNLKSYTQLDYLINHADISYASSHSILKYQIKRDQDSNNKVIGYAIDYENFPIGQYSQLERSIEELQSLASASKLKTYTKQEATHSSFFDEAKEASVIHLSLHGITDTTDPALSYLQFYPENDEDDGKVFIKDIYHKDIDPELIVLSSCSSGDGYLSEAEGSISFAHAFSYSSAQSVILNLWDSASSSSFELIQGFYKNLFQGLSKSKALQQSKIDYLNGIKAQELAHPFYWATLVMYGDPSPIQLGHLFSYSYLKWTLVLIFLIGIYFISRIRRAASVK